MNPLLTLSATRLAQLIRKGVLTSVETVQAHISRIRQVNPVLNALVRDRFDRAIEEAKQADERLTSTDEEDLPPLWGVPCSIKEAFALEGMPHTGGLYSRIGIVAEEDATAVARLKQAGAIPLGVTNLSELGMWMESNNRVYGRSNNPYNPTRTTGGSSGGEGALVGAGASPFGLGSDIGGSIRLPSFFNGVFGHKPSGGLVPNTGQYPMPAGEVQKFVATGPLTRSAEDLMPLLRILAGPDDQDLGCRSLPLGNPADVDIRQLTILNVPDNGAVRVSRDLRRVQQAAADYLARRGATVERVRVHGLRDSLLMWMAKVSSGGGPTFGELMGDGRPPSGLVELFKWGVGRSSHTLPAIVLAMLEKLAKVAGSHSDTYVRKCDALRDELVERIGPSGVMLYPSYSRPAPRHHTPMLTPFDWVYTGIMNVLEFPSTQVPMGLNRKGLPLGIQVVGIPQSDHRTIRVAMELERGFGGWKPPAALGQD